MSDFNKLLIPVLKELVPQWTDLDDDDPILLDAAQRVLFNLTNFAAILLEPNGKVAEVKDIVLEEDTELLEWGTIVSLGNSSTAFNSNWSTRYLMNKAGATTEPVFVKKKKRN
jgi:hypothetical protein